MKIIKTFRKTLSLNIDKTGKLIIKAPVFTSKKIIDSFVEKNKDWIEKRKNFILESVKTFTQGEKFLFFGEEYELKFSSEYKELYFDGMNFYLPKSKKTKAKELFIDFYKKEAKKYIENRIKEISDKYSLKYNSLKITSAKTRWGSCTSKKNINFSYRLIMAPIKTIDYVVVHELAHLKQMNHSKKFWSEVDIMMKGLYPGNYEIHKKWLKENGDKFIF